MRKFSDTSTTWWYDQTVLEVTGASSAKQTKPDTQQPKEQAIIGRAKMFHLCLVMITQLSRSPTLARTTTRRFSANPNEHVETSDVDQALLVATSLLQPASERGAGMPTSPSPVDLERRLSSLRLGSASEGPGEPL